MQTLEPLDDVQDDLNSADTDFSDRFVALQSMKGAGRRRACRCECNY